MRACVELTSEPHLLVFFLSISITNSHLLTYLTQIEDEKSCSYDYVDIYGGLDDYSGPLYGRYCGLNVSFSDKINNSNLRLSMHFFFFFFFCLVIWIFHLIWKLYVIRNVETSGRHFHE